MAKYANPDMIDGALDQVISNVTFQSICETQPANLAEASTLKGSGGKALAIVAIAGGDITKANGDVSGRKFVVAAKNGVDVDATGDGDHVALYDATTLWFVTTAPTQTLTSGNQVNIGTWQDEIRDPT